MLWYVHHHGNGHWRRALAVAEVACTPVVLASSAAPPWTLPANAEFLELPADADADGAGGTVGEAAGGHGDTDPTAGGALHWAPLGHRGLLQRHALLLRTAAELGVRHAVVDVSVEVTVLLRASGLAVTLVQLPGQRGDRPHQLGRDLATRLVSPTPPGWQLAGDAIPLGLVSPLAGPSHVRAARSDANDLNGPVVVVAGAGGGGLEKRALGFLRQAAAPREVVVAAGGQDMAITLGAASVVVGATGLGTVADVAAVGRPFVALPAERPHGEQQATAEALRLRRLAVVPGSSPDSVEAWRATLETAAELGPLRAAVDGAEHFAALLDGDQ